MTTLHRKSRGASEQTINDASYYYTTIDAMDASSSSSTNNSSKSKSAKETYVSESSSNNVNSSKARRSSRYIRRSSHHLFSGSGHGSGPPSSQSPSSSSSRKMSTLQLRAFFTVCVLLYFSTLFFAEDIVNFGKFMSSEQTRQKIFSQWKPMHSAAKQYLRAAIADPLGTETNRNTEQEDFVKTAAVALGDAVVTNADGEAMTTPAPSANVQREPPVVNSEVLQEVQSLAPAKEEEGNATLEKPVATEDREKEAVERFKQEDVNPVEETREQKRDADSEEQHEQTLDPSPIDDGGFDGDTTEEDVPQVPDKQEDRPRDSEVLSAEPEQNDAKAIAEGKARYRAHGERDKQGIPDALDENETDRDVADPTENANHGTPKSEEAVAEASDPAVEEAKSPPSEDAPIDLSEVEENSTKTPDAAEEEEEDHETQDGFHHHHLDEAR